MRNTILESIGLLIGRLALGVYFAMAGWAKITVAGGVSVFADQNMGAALENLPEAFARPFLLCLPFVELVAGVALVLGLLTRVVGLLIAAMLVSFILGMTGLTHLGGGPFHENVVFLALALLFFFCGAGRYALDGRAAIKKARVEARGA